MYWKFHKYLIEEICRKFHMSSAGNLQEIVPYHVVGNVQEICKFPAHFHHLDMCWKCHLSCKFPAHILLQEMPHFFLCKFQAKYITSGKQIIRLVGIMLKIFIIILFRISFKNLSLCLLLFPKILIIPKIIPTFYNLFFSLVSKLYSKTLKY